MNSRTGLDFNVLFLVLSAVLSVTSALIPATVYQHFADTSYSVRQYVCSEEEQVCLRDNQLLYEGDGKCYTVGEQGPCESYETFHVDKREATRLGGHLRGICGNGCEDSSHAPLVTTGQCMSKSDVESKICRSEWYLQASKDAFGQWVCEWTQLPCSPPERRPGFRGEYERPYTGTCFPPNIFASSDALRPVNDSKVPLEPPSDHPLLEYFEKKTYLEREYPCSEAEAECLRYGRVLHSDGNCYKAHEWTGKCEPGQTFNVDLREANRQGGHLLGTCRSLCRRHGSPLAATGKCVDYAGMTKLCRHEWGMHPAHDVFGQMVCQCRRILGAPSAPTTTAPPPAISARPVATPGNCRAPDFSNPTSTPNYDSTLTLGFRVPCSEAQWACLREGRVLVGGACHVLRTRGPCAPGEQLVLDKKALARERLLPTCVPAPCPEGSVLLPADGRCLTHQQVTSLLCPRRTVALDEFGGWLCGYSGHFPGNLTSIVRNAEDGSCELPDKFGYHRNVLHGVPPPIVHNGVADAPVT